MSGNAGKEVATARPTYLNDPKGGDVVLPSGERIFLSPDIIRSQVIRGRPEACTDQEVMFALVTCRARQLNPLTGEIYFIKYSANDPLQIVVAKDTILTRALTFPTFEGYDAGVVIMAKDGTIHYPAGTLLPPEHQLIGGWARVYVKDRRYPMHSVNLAEYQGRKGDGSVTRMWQLPHAGGKACTMIRKVALVQALREAYPEALGRLHEEEEMPPLEAEITEVKDETPKTRPRTLEDLQPRKDPPHGQSAMPLGEPAPAVPRDTSASQGGVQGTLPADVHREAGAAPPPEAVKDEPGFRRRTHRITFRGQELLTRGVTAETLEQISLEVERRPQSVQEVVEPYYNELKLAQTNRQGTFLTDAEGKELARRLAKKAEELQAALEALNKTPPPPVEIDERWPVGTVVVTNLKKATGRVISYSENLEEPSRGPFVLLEMLDGEYQGKRVNFYSNELPDQEPAALHASAPGAVPMTPAGIPVSDLQGAVMRESDGHWLIDCPMEGGQMEPEYCFTKCQSRQGCPSLEI